MELTENARLVLRSRYLLKNERGEPAETPEEMVSRVASAVAMAEPKASRALWAKRFVELMASRRFLPNSPTLMNAGKPQGQLSACYVLPVADSLDGIFGSLKNAAKIHQSGGGTGFSFSRLRPKGSSVTSSAGAASGPISFMRIFDVATETIKQGGTRRGANMAVLRVDHPDILEFIDAKRDHKSILNFNVSVGVTEEFVHALRSRGTYALLDPQSPKCKKPIRELRAQEVFDRIAQAAWECGDPGLVFLDQIARFNPTPDEGEMESTNPCGEQPLLPYESCNLGSLNLGLYWRAGEFDWPLFGKDISIATRFLDDVIDVNEYPVRECEKITLKNRKIGLGVMGFADLLLMAGLPYESPEARDLGEKLMAFLDRRAKTASMKLAKEKGAFPGYRRSIWKALGFPPLRNATVSTVAPTGTISIIAGASSGIEPIFSAVFYRNVLDGKRLLDVHPAVSAAMKSRGLALEALTEQKVEQALGQVWSPAWKVSIDGHVRMQAAFQRFSDSAVSKTINLHESATVDDVKRAYRLALDLGCKGITIYRDRSRPTQVLEGAVCGRAEEAACPEC